jgi:hypothetical protein
VITPLGLAHRPRIRAICREHRLGFVLRAPILDWASASIPVYVRTLDDERLRLALCFAALWRTAVPQALAELWLFPQLTERSALERAKQAIRAATPMRHVRLEAPGIALPTPDQIVRLHAIHVPDAERLAIELAVLRRLADRRAWREQWLDLPEAGVLIAPDS